jgi:hypothetical protein
VGDTAEDGVGECEAVLGAQGGEAGRGELIGLDNVGR